MTDRDIATTGRVITGIIPTALDMTALVLDRMTAGITEDVAGVRRQALEKYENRTGKSVAQKGNFCVTLDSKILMYNSTLRFSHLRKP